MKKRVLMSLVLLAIIGTSAVFAQQPTMDKLRFIIVGPTSNPTGYSVSPANDNISGEVVIPDTYNNLPVTTISNGAFWHCYEITSVTLGKNMAYIGGNAFVPESANASRYKLTSVTFQSSDIRFNGVNHFQGDLVAKYQAGGAGTYTRQAGGTVWTKQGGFSLNGTWTRSDGMKITITENGQNITITGDKPNNGGRLNDTYTKR